MLLLLPLDHFMKPLRAWLCVILLQQLSASFSITAPVKAKYYDLFHDLIQIVAELCRNNKGIPVDLML